MSRRGLARVLAVAAMAGGTSLVASCNVLLSLNKYVDCPGDPSCPADATCGDGMKDGTETDVDCGGPCSPCADGKGCKVGSDCTSTTCVDLVCLASTCNDKVKDGTETDVDCGGTCPPCTDGKGCGTGSDCADKVCSMGACLPPSCTDKVQNGTETDVDCGGSCSQKCGFNEGCAQDADCIGMVCMAGKCAAACNDGVQNGAETGVDCGGPTCMPCAAGGGCKGNADCQSGVCQTLMCAATDVWSKSFDDTTTGSDASRLTVTLDPTDDVILSGTFNGNLQFGVAPLNSGGQDSTFLAKFDKTGTPLWSSTFASVIEGLATDATGNIYTAGAFQGIVNLGTNCYISKPATTSVLITKLDPTGTVLSCEGYGTSGSQIGRTINVDSAGNILVTGILIGTVDFGQGPLTGSGLYDTFVAKMASGSSGSWSKAILSAGTTSAAVDSTGNVFLVGLLSGTTNFGPTAASALTQVGNQDIIVAKLDPTGAYLWSKSFGHVNAFDATPTIAVDAGGNLFITGYYTGVIDFGGGPFTAVSQDGYLAKLDPNGNHLWSKHFASPQAAAAGGVALDTLGQPTVVGNFTSSVDLGGGSLTATGGQQGNNAFVAKFDAAGNYLWARSFGDGTGDTPDSVAIDSTGAAVLTGTFDGGLNFGGNPMTSAAGSTDLFLAKLRTP